MCHHSGLFRWGVHEHGICQPNHADKGDVPHTWRMQAAGRLSTPLRTNIEPPAMMRMFAAIMQAERQGWGEALSQRGRPPDKLGRVCINMLDQKFFMRRLHGSHTDGAAGSPGLSRFASSAAICISGTSFTC